jgi:chromosome segregation ATPase
VDPFAKVTELIKGMIAKLQEEGASDATEKSYCDDELSKTAAKKDELNADISKMSTSIDQASARSTKLKGDVKELQKELATLAKELAENEEWRQTSHADYVQAKSDLELGLNGVRQAVVVLRKYYANNDASGAALLQQPVVPQHAQATGAGNSIIGILELVESDFAANLAKEETSEATAQDAHDEYVQETKIDRTTKEQDVKYKTQEYVGLDKHIASVSSDRDNTNTELSAVLEYDSKLKARCIAKPESYGERSKRREAEIAGLREALSILAGETAFVQRGSSRRGLRVRGTLSADGSQ